MLKKNLIIAAVAGWGFVAQATIQTLTAFNNSDAAWTPNAAIPDANAAGVGFNQNLNNFGATYKVSSVTVTLNISGGWNGDLYCYLSHGGQTAVLLNRVGRDAGKSLGYGDSGMNVTFSDAAANGIHTYRQVSGYSITGGATWQPDGRATDPSFVRTSDSSTKMLSSFSQSGGVLANGDWTLFIADMAGGSQSRLVSWSLQVQAIPEPVEIALGVFGGLFTLIGLWRSKWLKKAKAS